MLTNKEAALYTSSSTTSRLGDPDNSLTNFRITPKNK